MPELPEVETIARDLAASIVGARIASVWGSGFGLHLGRAVDLVGLRRVATGRCIVRVRRKGKFLLLEVGDAGDDAGARPGIVVHLGMSGRLRVEAAGAHRAPHTHVVFGLGDGRELRFIDARRFGWVAPGTPVEGRPELAGLGPDPLDELDPAALARRLEGVRAPIKAFLLDQRRVAGLGNIYVSEALHRAGIHPTTPAGRVHGRAGALLDGIRAALELGIRNRGTSLRDYVDASGTRGNNAAALRVYGRAGQPCPVCAAAVQRRVDAGRSTFYCPDCQPRDPARAKAKARAKALAPAATSARGRSSAPSTAKPSTATPSTAKPSTAKPSTATPSTATPSTAPSTAKASMPTPASARGRSPAPSRSTPPTRSKSKAKTRGRAPHRARASSAAP